MKTSELTGAALDWAVAKCMTGGEIFQSGRVAHAVVLHVVGGTTAPYFVKDSGVVRYAFEPSTNWEQGGPIIEREEMEICPIGNGEWRGQFIRHGELHRQYGDTPLVAAMRCYVSSNLGDLVNLPKELK